MSQDIEPISTVHATARSRWSSTRRLLSAGIVAGPLFMTIWALQAYTREGFDPSRHPISLLSLGDLGWVQVASFTVTGALFVACAVGMRRAMRGEPAGTWGPRLVGALGAGLVVAGVFVTDAGAGYPAGAPTGAPEMTLVGVLHEVGFVMVMLSWTVACFVFRRRFTAMGQRALARLSVVVVCAVLVLGGWPDPDSFAMRTVVATAVQLGYLAVLAAHLRARLSADPT